MKQETVIVLGIPIDNITMEEAVDRIFHMIEAYSKDERPRQVATVNVDFMVNTLSWRSKNARHPELLDIFRRADLVTADGMPVVWSGRLMGAPIKERVTGSDLVPKVAEEAARRGKSIYLLGGRDGVGKAAANILEQRYPGLKIAGVYSPYVQTEGEGILESTEQDPRIIDEINQSGADILLIGFGNPKQEIWFDRNRGRLKVPVSIGTGGTYEFIAGSVKRAPIWLQRAGLEWIFRIIQEPKRLWKRYFIGLFKFSFMALPAILFYQFTGRFNKGVPAPYSLRKREDQTLSEKNSTVHIKVLKMPERVDAFSIESIGHRAGPAMQSGYNIIFDFTDTSFIDSSGMGLIVRLWHRFNKEGSEIYITGMNIYMENFLRVNRLWDLFKDVIYEDINEIVKTIRRKTALLPFLLVSGAGIDVFHIHLYGRLDAGNMSDLDMASIVGEIGEKDCILNMTELEYVDSTGLVFFLKILKHLSKYKKVPILCDLNNTVRQMFLVTKLIDLFKIAPDVFSAKRMLEKTV